MNQGGIGMRENYRFVTLFAVMLFLCMIPQEISAADKEYDFNKNKVVTIAEEECYHISGNDTWLKYKPKADGYLSIRASDLENSSVGAKGYLTLYNSTKLTALSSKSIFYNAKYQNNAYWYEVIFGLKKDTTYYIRIRSDNSVKFSCTFTKTVKKAGNSKNNSLNMKKNKWKTGLIPAGISNSDWYKLKLTKKQKLRLYYTAKTRGSFKISIYSSKQLIGNQNVYYTSSQRKVTLYQYMETSKKKTGLSPGTYYIKIERADSTSSGFYKIKWN